MGKLNAGAKDYCRFLYVPSLLPLSWYGTCARTFLRRGRKRKGESAHDISGVLQLESPGFHREKINDRNQGENIQLLAAIQVSKICEIKGLKRSPVPQLSYLPFVDSQ